MIEIEIGVLYKQCLDDRIPNEETLVRQIVARETACNKQYATFNWAFTSIDACNKLKRLYPVLRAVQFSSKGATHFRFQSKYSLPLCSCATFYPVFIVSKVRCT